MSREIAAPIKSEGRAEPLRLNIGSGNAPLPGYCNLDIKFGDHAERLPHPDNSADLIRASHVLEHIRGERVPDTLKEWVRVLRPGGWLQVAVPDFAWCVAAYRGEKPTAGDDPIPLAAYILGGQQDEHDYHRGLFDDATLRQLLADAGLTDIQQWKSDVPDCASLPVSLNLMGRKPWRCETCNGVLGKVWNDPSYTLCEDCLSKPESIAKWDTCPGCGLRYSVNPWGACVTCLNAGRAEAHRARCPHGRAIGGVPGTRRFAGHIAHCECCRDDFGTLNLSDSLCPVCATKPEPPAPRRITQVFAAGRWQDAAGPVTVAPGEEDDARAGKLPARVIEGETRAVKIACVMSIPRIGYLDCIQNIQNVVQQAGGQLLTAQGVFWSHALSRAIRAALDWRGDAGEQFDFILTADYDTYPTLENLKGLASLLAREPDVDCVVPMQVKRQLGELLATTAGGVNMTLPLVPIRTGHFGFTLFRRSFFERLPRPWFWERPDEHGDWGPGRIDPDIGFWLGAEKAGLRTMLATRVIVGHGDELVSWPRLDGGRIAPVHQSLIDWYERQAPPEGL